MIFQIKVFVRIRTVDVIHGCKRKRIISCGGEIITPGKIIDPAGVLCGDFFGAICGAGINDDDFVHHGSNGIQASCQNRFFILTIIHKLIVIIITDGPSEVFLLYYTILQQFYIEIKKYTCIFFEPWL